MKKVKDAMPVYDICALSGNGHQHADIIAEPFADYLRVHPNLHKAHGHSFYHLVLFTRGGGYHTVDFNHFPVTEGQVYFMVPGQVHSWSFEGDTEGYVVNFSEALFQSFLADQRYLERFRFFSGDATEQVIVLGKEKLQEAVAIMTRIVDEARQTGALHLDAARMHLLLFFILVADVATADKNELDKIQPNQLVLQNFRKLVGEHYTRYKLPKEYAAMLYVTPNYLNALCNDLLGKSAGDVIRERILLEAKRQLVNLDESIAGIGYNLGFTDNSYFTKFFKKYTGVTPEDFRRQLQAPTAKN
jgi:AraC-like DNA-binding protein